MPSNQEYGGELGYSFNEQSNGLPVKTLDLYCAVAAGHWGSYVVRGMQIVFRNEDTHIVGKITGDKYSFSFRNEEENVKRMSVWTGDLVDKIEIHTTFGNSFAAGGSGGYQHDYEVGDGTMIRLHGGAGDNVDKLGVDFI